MKYTEVTSTHKKHDKTDKKNYCPISILPNRNKVYERLRYLSIFSNNILQISVCVSESF